MMIINIAILSAALLVPSNSFSSVATDNNLREQCRKRVAGLHLMLRDKVELSKRRLKRLQNQNDNMAIKIKDLRKNVNNLKNDQKKDKLNFELKEQTDYALNRIRQLETFTNRNQEQIDAIKLTASDDARAFDKWIAKLKPAYRIKKYHGENSLGYPFEIVYEKKCPDFLTSCPLDGKAKKAVKNIFEGYPFPVECERYLGQN
jgi:vacuolar-type H+-ATPase subunit I/STV1